jgi:small subunit ribosomal protein S19
MARKEFTFRGRTAGELAAMSIDELALILPSNERRKIRRGFTPEEKSLLRKLAKRDRIKTQAREMIVLPSMFGKTIMVHSGKEYLPVLVQPEMVGRRLGSYVLTRKMVKHSAAGVSAAKAEEGGKSESKESKAAEKKEEKKEEKKK